jgi:hypothetical protein
MTVLAFSSTILLMCMRTSNTMSYPMSLKEGVKITVFTLPIRLDMNNFSFEEALNMCLELKKDSEHIRLTLK